MYYLDEDLQNIARNVNEAEKKIDRVTNSENVGIMSKVKSALRKVKEALKNPFVKASLVGAVSFALLKAVQARRTYNQEIAENRARREAERNAGFNQQTEEALTSAVQNLSEAKNIIEKDPHLVELKQRLMKKWGNELRRKHPVTGFEGRERSVEMIGESERHLAALKSRLMEKYGKKLAERHATASPRFSSLELDSMCRLNNAMRKKKMRKKSSIYSDHWLQPWAQPQFMFDGMYFDAPADFVAKFMNRGKQLASTATKNASERSASKVTSASVNSLGRAKPVARSGAKRSTAAIENTMAPAATNAAPKQSVGGKVWGKVKSFFGKGENASSGGVNVSGAAKKGARVKVHNPEAKEGFFSRAKNKVKSAWEKHKLARAEKKMQKLERQARKENAAERAAKEKESVWQGVKNTASGIKNWAKDHPKTTAALAGAGAGALAHSELTRSERDSKWGNLMRRKITMHDNQPWVKGANNGMSIKRYIDRQIRRRLNDLGPGEFDPDIPLYNNRLPQARQAGGYVSRPANQVQYAGPSAGHLDTVKRMIINVRGIPEELRRTYGLPLERQNIDNIIDANMRIVYNFANGNWSGATTAQSAKKQVYSAISDVKDVLNRIKQKYLFDESDFDLSHNQKLQAKIKINSAIKTLDDMSALMISFFR